MKHFTTKDLANIFNVSHDTICKYIVLFNLPIKTIKGKKYIITLDIIKHNDKLYNSLMLVLNGKMNKVFYTRKDIQKKLNKCKTRTTQIMKKDLQYTVLGNKFIIWAIDAYNPYMFKKYRKTNTI